MNQFTIDLRRQSLPGEGAAETLERIGAAYRKRILGSWCSSDTIELADLAHSLMRDV
jgi:hypothetical protein